MASIYTAALMEHNAHPDYKYQMDEPTCTHDGVNPSCGDELTLALRLRGDRIEEAAFTGHGCAVSQAAADMMADLVTGETVGEARRLSGLYLDMIKGRPLTDEERADLDEAAELGACPPASNAPSWPGERWRSCWTSNWKRHRTQSARRPQRATRKRSYAFHKPKPIEPPTTFKMTSSTSTTRYRPPTTASPTVSWASSMAAEHATRTNNVVRNR